MLAADADERRAKSALNGQDEPMRGWRSVSFAVTLCGAGFSTMSSVGAQCVAPQLEASSSAVRPGESVTLRGDGFDGVGCDDTPMNGDRRPEPVPQQDIEIVFVQDDREQIVGEVDAAEDFTIRTAVAVPSDAHAGEAEFRALGWSVEIRIEGADRSLGETALLTLAAGLVVALVAAFVAVRRRA